MTLKAFKAWLSSDPKVRADFQACREEYIMMRSGGRSRLSSFRTAINFKRRAIVEIQEPKKHFITMTKFRKKYGDAKALKAKVRFMRNVKNVLVPGVVMRVGEKGVHKMKRKCVAEVDQTECCQPGRCWMRTTWQTV